MPEPLERVTLTGVHVRLEPLAVAHVSDLVAAATIDRTTYGLTDVPSDAAAMTRYVERLLGDHARASALPFAQRRLGDGVLVGCTRYLDVRWWRDRHVPDEVEIGGTWLAATAQRTAINTEAKRLLLGYAFEELGVWRVAVCTDVRNERSRVAIERLGATFEGVLRKHRLRADADEPTARDTAVYAIIDDDWPAVRARLDELLAAAV